MLTVSTSNANGVNIRQYGGVTSPSPRATYHHGNLTEALTEAATTLARTGGPEAVVLREAARKVGVSAAAAYRHFANHSDLMHAVKQHGQAALAARMIAELSSEPAGDDPGENAVRRLRGFGFGYLAFAREEPGLFRTAFCRIDSAVDPRDAAMFDSPAYQLLVETLDELVTLGRMRPERRPFAEVGAWSTSHGLAMLVLDGPLSCTPDEVITAASAAAIDAMIAGLTS